MILICSMLSQFSVPPIPNHPPILIEARGRQASIELNANDYFGDGPIIARHIQYRLRTSNNYDPLVVPDLSDETFTLTNLQGNREYGVRVVLSRAGEPAESGVGDPGPELFFTTECEGKHFYVSLELVV